MMVLMVLLMWTADNLDSSVYDDDNIKTFDTAPEYMYPRMVSGHNIPDQH